MATITKRGQSYQIRVSCGYDVDGKQIRRTRTWRPDAGMSERQIQKELDRQAVLFEEQCRTGRVLDGNIRLADFIDLWFDKHAATHLRPTTVAGYRKLVARTVAALGHIRVDKLQPRHLMAFYENLAEPGIRAPRSLKARPALRQRIKKAGMTTIAIDRACGWPRGKTSKVLYGDGLSAENCEKLAALLGVPVDRLFEAQEDKPLSGNSILHYHRFLSSLMTSAVRWQLRFDNPCLRVTPPRKEDKEAVYLDEAQAARLLLLLDAEPEDFRAMVTLLLYTGLRRSELLGLAWEDIDWDKQLLSVRRTAQYVAGQGTITDTTKTRQSRRVLKLTDSAFALLRRHRAAQMQEELKLGDKWQHSGRIFTTWDGRPMNPNALSRRMHSFIQRTDLPPITAHSLRHTNATLLIAEGVNIKTVSAHLGHSTISTTGNIYAHAIQSAEAAAADALETTLSAALHQQKAAK